MPKVSIITTTYNHEKFIAQTIESVLSQTFTDWELLIGDDSPSDASWKIIAEYTKKYPEKIHAWHHSPNKGIVGNTNFLLEHISEESEFVAFLEGDDLYTPDNLEKKLEVFRKYREVQLVYSDLSFIDGQDTVILESFFHYRGVPFFQNEMISVNDFILLPAGPIASWSTGMVRRTMIEKYPVVARWEDKRYSIADYDFYFQVATANQVYGIDEPLTQYRRHGGNLSGANGGTSGDLGRWIDLVFREGQIPETVYKTKKSWLSITFAIFALEHGQKKEAWKYFLDACKFHPFYKLHYKIGILGFLVIPAFLGKKILRTLIRRGD
ncbi:MAG: glycosyltransferase [Candidatus Gracilibacteria bacterium]|nr:glycosyltransferase [Candidatus Gracilibacteria bacterium]